MIRGYLKLSVVGARNLKNRDFKLLPFVKAASDPHVEVKISGQTLLITETITDSLNPQWNCKAFVPLCHSDDHLTIDVWDSDLLTCQSLGKATASLRPFDKKWERDTWIQLDEGSGEVYLSLSFQPFEGPASVMKPEPLGDGYYFPARKGGMFSLYQDAHISGIPNVINDEKIECRNAFEDIAEAFEKAKKVIYITGWSVYTSLKLRRRGTNSETLGELLIRKANEGVRVLILIWNEKFSARLCRELIGTHDTETINYFENTAVHAVSVRRKALHANEIKENLIETFYTHHMKMIIVDDPTHKLVSFVGGMDLTDGRWDTPDHPLWHTLTTIHKGDFYNGFFPGLNENSGPREPYHDLHSMIGGPAAFDCLCTFEERWKRQVPKLVNLLVPLKAEDYLNVNIAEGRSWHLQALRSIDSDSSYFDPLNEKLNHYKNVRKDCSITAGLVNLIRSTRKFLYVESQYFIGSSHLWHAEQTACAFNVVPAEIAAQIVYGIKNKSPIRAYIVLPLSPEGDAKSRIGASSMNAILRWQFLSIQSIYSRIAEALKQDSSDDHPEDYLLILSTGKKSSRSRTARSIPTEVRPQKGSDAYNLLDKARFPIYIHSKMVLSDDARIIIGSANLNQRSLDGSRDTEMAIAASQVDHGSGDDTREELVYDGEVGNFRRNLWKEHTEGLSESDPKFLDPSSKECIRHMRELSLEALRDYASDSVDKDIPFRFIKFPYHVSKDGQLSALPEIPTIPDIGLPVSGKSGGFIPSAVTT